MRERNSHPFPEGLLSVLKLVSPRPTISLALRFVQFFDICGIARFELFRVKFHGSLSFGRKPFGKFEVRGVVFERPFRLRFLLLFLLVFSYFGERIFKRPSLDSRDIVLVEA